MNPVNDSLTFIKSQHPFDCLDEEELQLIEQTLKTAAFAFGTYVLTQNGPPSEYLYVIREGVVRRVRDGQVVQILEEGDLFGYPSMFNQEVSSVDVVVEEDVSLCLIPAKTFYVLIDNASFAEFFLKSLSDRLRHNLTVPPPTLGVDLTTPVRELIIRPPVMVSPAATVSEAAQAMQKAWVNAVLIQDTPPGIVTDRDFRTRVLAEGLGPETPIKYVMSRPLKMLPADTPIHGALLFLLQENIQHLVLNEGDQIVGIVNVADLVRHQAKSPFYLLKQLENLDTPDVLARYSLEIAGTIEAMFKGGLDVTHIGRVIASLNDALMRRLLQMAESELGPPPTPYAWLVLGSGGRMEQALLTDQDNALAYLDDTPEAKTYFTKFTERVVNGLIQAGFPPCSGGYMATNWRKTRVEWESLFRGWITNPKPQALLEMAIFFDFRVIHGELSLESLDQLVSETSQNSIFLAHMTRAALEFRPPLGFFRRIRVEEDGQVDLKAGGIAPIVSLARVYALQAGSRARSTLERIEAAQQAGVLSQTGAETLIETYRFLFHLRLRDQLASVEVNQLPDNKVHLDALSAVEKRHLKDAFMAIREMQEAISQQLTL